MLTMKAALAVLTAATIVASGANLVTAAPSNASTRAATAATPAAVVGATSPAQASTPPTYRAAVLADSPTVYYPFDEVRGGTASDASGHHVDGTYASGVELGVPGALHEDDAPAVRSHDGGAVLTAPRHASRRSRARYCRGTR